MGVIGNLVVGVTANTEGLAKGMRAGKAEISSFAKTAEMLEHTMKHLLVGMAAGFALEGLHETAEQLEKITLASKRLGTTTEGLSALAGAAKISDVQLESVVKDLTFMEKNLGKNDAPFKKLHLNISELKSMKADEAFLEIAEAISKLPTAADRTAASVAIFGKSGAELLPILMKGKAGIKELEEEVGSLGGVFSSLSAEEVEKMNEAMKKLSVGFTGLKYTIVTTAAPAITQITDNMILELKIINTLIGAVEKYIKALQDLERWKKVGNMLSFAVMSGRNFAPGESSIAPGANGEGALEVPGAGSPALFKSLYGSASGAMSSAANFLDPGSSFASQSAAGDIRNRILGIFGGLKYQFENDEKGFWHSLGLYTAPEAMKPDDILSDPKFARINNAIDEMIAESRGPQSARHAMRAADQIPGNAALEKGTAAAFSQAHRSSEASKILDVSKQQLKTQQQSAKALQNIDANLKKTTVPVTVNIA